MSKTSPLLLVWIAVINIGPLGFCGCAVESPTTEAVEGFEKRSPTAPRELLVSVNGAPVGEQDVDYRLKNNSHAKQVTLEHKKIALETIIRQELRRQKAVELGLDNDPGYLAELRKREVVLDAFKRDALSRVFFKREIKGKVEVTDEDVKKYFAENIGKMRTEFHVWQIMRRGQAAQIEQDYKDIQFGKPFEEVAGNRFSGIPVNDRPPWDLGYLNWVQIPEPWRAVIHTLKEGEVSGVIKGPRQRFWIIKLVDKRVNEELSSEIFKRAIVEVLKNKKIEALGKERDRELRNKSEIVYSRTSPIKLSK
jgi:foldase protein PrsA